MLSIINLPGDSANYEVLREAAMHSRDVPGLACEIGLRRGGGSKVIIDAIAGSGKTLIAIDPYGNIEYRPNDFQTMRLDYTNAMRDEALVNMYNYCRYKNINFYFYNMEDTEFFNRFADGVPIYNEYKEIVNEYSLVHFDGPHDVESLKIETSFFALRTPVGGTWCFDDIHDYNHGLIEEECILPNGFDILMKEGRKAAYVKVV